METGTRVRYVGEGFAPKDVIGQVAGPAYGNTYEYFWSQNGTSAKRPTTQVFFAGNWNGFYIVNTDDLVPA